MLQLWIVDQAVLSKTWMFLTQLHDNERYLFFNKLLYWAIKAALIRVDIHIGLDDQYIWIEATLH